MSDRFHIPEGCFWEDVRKESVDIGTILNTSFRAIEEANRRLKGVFQNVASRVKFNRVKAALQIQQGDVVGSEQGVNFG